MAFLKISEPEWQVRKDLASCYHLVDYFGWTDLIYTHISARVPGADDLFLINEFGLNFHEITPENLVTVNGTGQIIPRENSHWEDGNRATQINLAGYVIHSAVHQARPEIQCVMHTHSPAGMAISTLACGLLPLTQHACRFYNRLAYHDFEGIAFDKDEQPRLVADLGDKRSLILRNHGFLTAGRTIGEAFTLMYFLEKAAQAQLTAQATGQSLHMPPPDICEKTARQFQKDDQPAGSRVWPAMIRLLDTLAIT